MFGISARRKWPKQLNHFSNSKTTTKTQWKEHCWLIAGSCTSWTENPDIYHRSFQGSRTKRNTNQNDFLPSPWSKTLKTSSSVSVLMPVSHLPHHIRPSTSQHDSSVIHPVSVTKTVWKVSLSFFLSVLCLHLSSSHQVSISESNLIHQSTQLKGLRSTLLWATSPRVWHPSLYRRLNLLDTLGSPL